MKQEENTWFSSCSVIVKLLLRRIDNPIMCTNPSFMGLSANAFEGDREKYMQQGLDEYLTKPLSKDDFQEVLEKVFSA